MAGSYGEGWEVPESASPWSDFHWFKVTGKKMLEVVILSRQPVWYIGHYERGRMVPCYGDGCKLCHEGVGAQVRFVFAVAETSTRRVGMIEVGKGIADLIRDWVPRCGGLRGMYIELYKHSHAKNSRMEVNYNDCKIPNGILDREGPDCVAALRSTWQKAKVEIPEQFTEEAAVKSFLRGHLEEVRKTR